MIVTDYTADNGKTYAEVTEGATVVYRTPDYLTARMAVADAVAWVAFHGPAGAMTLGAIKAYREGLAMRAKMAECLTVTVSTGTHTLTWDVATRLMEGTPNSRNIMPGTMGSLMIARQRMFREVAERLGISPREARELPRLLRANMA
jgi:hypothetical protein